MMHVFGRLWRRLVALVKRWLRIPIPPTPLQKGGKRGEAEGRRLERQASQPSEAEIEQIFMQLLEEVAQGTTRGGIQGFFIAQGITEAALVRWLHGFGERVLASSATNQELAVRLVQLAEVYGGELGRVAQGIGRQLGEREREANPPKIGAAETGEVGQDEDLLSREAKVWFDRGIALGNLRRYEKEIAC